jgi:hypothetical protein
MGLNEKSLQSELFDVKEYVITVPMNNNPITRITLPHAEYDGVIDYPYILQKQYVVGQKVSDYLGVPFTWPKRTQFDDLPKDVYGETIPEESTIKYSHSLKGSYWLQEITPGHETAHLQTRGLDKLLRMYSVYIVFDDQKLYFIPVPVGQMLVEGGTEVLLEKVHEPRGSYESWYQLTSEIDQEFPVKNIFYTAQNYDITGIWQRLYSGPIEIIDNYVSDSLKESGLKEPFIVGRVDF